MTENEAAGLIVGQRVIIVSHDYMRLGYYVVPDSAGYYCVPGSATPLKVTSNECDPGYRWVHIINDGYATFYPVGKIHLLPGGQL